MANKEHLESLDRADLKIVAEDLNIEFAGNIPTEKLIAKIMDDTADEDEAPARIVEVEGVKKAKKQTVAEMKKEMNLLMRVRVSANDPQYKGRNGISIKVGNAKVIVGKFIPFDMVYHIQKPVYDAFKRKKWRETKFKTDPATGNKIPVVTMRPGFVIEDLEPLTQTELKKLAAEQAARGSISEDVI